ncbi:metallophosphoesterase [Magnetofaba australis]|uniref:Putative metallophosphoesterase n=1 Tax=Magnetofaba australis IT-1 TaxID=1434232 RepID=A0A1Y2K4W5_9PROT|nr:metallophosphoesterase [Magnetofaba australis]OSM04448.1 putative metallophosphoesterase [Magnetofaba australis IT-1]
MVTLLQLSDCHLFAEADGKLFDSIPALAPLQAVAADLRQSHPDATLGVLTGDLSQDESAASYAHCMAALSGCDLPFLAIPGNHDDVATMQQAFAQGGSIRLFLGELRLAGWRLLLLDSCDPDGDEGGLLGEERLAELDALLSKDPDTPTQIWLHHPPVGTGSAWFEAKILKDGAALLALLEKHKQVKGVVCGHAHEALDTTLPSGARLVSAPSTCVQFLPKTPTLHITAQPPGYRWHRLDDGGVWETGVTWLQQSWSPALRAMGPEPTPPPSA